MRDNEVEDRETELFKLLALSRLSPELMLAFSLRIFPIYDLILASSQRNKEVSADVGYK